MQSTRAKLPPLASLLTFEAAARQLSFTRAARELNVTQGAVSRQILALESFLGCALFNRLHRALSLTPAGQRLQAAVTLAFGHLVETVSGLQQAPRRPRVTLATTTAFASLWVMPRMPRFYETHPGVEVRLVAVDEEPQFARDGIDLAILYGKGRWPGCRATRLLDEVIFPVCSRSYLARAGRPAGLADLPRHALLHWQGPHRHWIGWPDWLRAKGLAPEELPSTAAFSSYTLLLQAAVSGQGIALGWRHLVDDFIATGQLVRALDEELASGRGYFLVVPGEQVQRGPIRQLADWIEVEAAGSRAQRPEPRVADALPPLHFSPGEAG